MHTLTTPEEIVREVERTISRERMAPIALRFEDAGVSTVAVVVPKETLSQMLSNLIKNASEAQDERAIEAPIDLTVGVRGNLVFHVLDRGPGLPRSVAQRLGQPFITTKGQTGGLGLGVYLARRFAERLGGTLRYASREGGGVDAELTLPLDSMAGTRE